VIALLAANRLTDPDALDAQARMAIVANHENSPGLCPRPEMDGGSNAWRSGIVCYRWIRLDALKGVAALLAGERVAEERSPHVQHSRAKRTDRNEA
jgi:hypothetical protein